MRRDDAETSDADLAVRAVTDRAAFGVLYDRYATAIYRYCYRRLGHRAAAEDATSGVFLRALEALPSYRGGSFRAWLYTIAHSVIVNGARRKTETHLDESFDAVDPEASPEECAVANDDRRQIVALLATLPEEQRRAVELRLAGLAGSEIAESLGKSIAAVKMLQHRALRRLQDQLIASGVDERTSDG